MSSPFTSRFRISPSTIMAARNFAVCVMAGGHDYADGDIRPDLCRVCRTQKNSGTLLDAIMGDKRERPQPKKAASVGCGYMCRHCNVELEAYLDDVDDKGTFGHPRTARCAMSDRVITKLDVLRADGSPPWNNPR